MKTCDRFSLKRIFHLIMNDLHLHAKIILIVAATVTLLFVLLPFHTSSSPSTYFNILYVGGLIVTSFAFSELDNASKAHLFLMQPCSTLEKLISKWMLTSVIYAFATLAVYYIFSLVSVDFYKIVFGWHGVSFSIFQSAIWAGIGEYFVMQAVVLLGAAAFRKYVLVKTVLALACFFMVLSAFSALVTWMLFVPGYFHNQVILEVAQRVGHIIIWFLLAPFCLYVAYLKLTEYELK